MNSRRDYYDVLGVPRNASQEEIRRAFRKQAMEWHPDRNRTPKAGEHFKEVNEAYQVLSDPAKRGQYDRFGFAGIGTEVGPGRGFEGFDITGGFGDIFDAFFGGSGARAETGPRRGADLHYAMTISFEEAVFGAEKEMQVSGAEVCSHCKGNRAEPGTSPTRCANCRGTGQVRRSQSSLFGQFVQVVTCNACRGEGKVITTPCSECKGTGRQSRVRRLRVQIPAGVDEGMQIKMSREGEAGWNWGPPGDLYMTLSVAPHPLFKRDGDHLVYELSVNVAQAALGDVVGVPLLEGGEEAVKVPAGIQSGSTLQVKGKGAPNVNTGRRGDLLVQVTVVVPQRLDARTRKLFEELAAALDKEEEPAPSDGKGWFGKFKDALGGEGR